MLNIGESVFPVIKSEINTATNIVNIQNSFETALTITIFEKNGNQLTAKTSMTEGHKFLVLLFSIFALGILFTSPPLYWPMFLLAALLFMYSRRFYIARDHKRVLEFFAEHGSEQ